ncbi:hypothetical protein ACO0QE_000655 [Hanseniaspora vineae]
MSEERENLLDNQDNPFDEQHSLPSQKHEDTFSLNKTNNDAVSLKAIASTEGLGSTDIKTSDLFSQPQEDPVIAKYRTACQNGDLRTVMELVDNSVVDLSEDSNPSDKVTGLHWAAINNKLSVVKYLISKGANVNAMSEGSNATPLHWAAKYGYVYIADYLLQKGADPALVDVQGFNILHLATLSSNIMLVLYILLFVVDAEKNIDINAIDNDGRTALLWAAYQGDLYSVQALLKLNASVNIADNQGFTPLHWAMVKGQPRVIKELIKYGSDLKAQTYEGKDIFESSLKTAFAENGLNEVGVAKKKWFKNPNHAKLITFIVPFFYLGIVFKVCSSWSFLGGLFLVAIPLLLIFFIFLSKFVVSSFINRVGLSKREIFRTICFRSPLFSGILGGSILWALYLHITRVVSHGEDLGWFYYMNSIFFLYCLLPYLFYKVMFLDPGYVEAYESFDKVREDIKELLSIGNFNSERFCLDLWIRKPLRSRYSHISEKLTLRFDHYCIWLYNEIGLNNHKYFMFFLVVLEISIFLMVKGGWAYFDYLEDLNKSKCIGLLGDDELCAAYKKDRFMLFMLGWFFFQCLWVTPLLAMQFMWTMKGCTTFEFEDSQKKRKQKQLPGRDQDFQIFETAPRDEFHHSGLDNSAEEDTGGNQVLPKPICLQKLESRAFVGGCLRLLGISNFFRIFNSKRSLRTAYVPTDYGYKTNLKDFWLTADSSAPIWMRFFALPFNKHTALLNGVSTDFATLYEYPERESGQV